MRDFSHLTGITIGGAAIALAVGSSAVTPAAGAASQVLARSAAGATIAYRMLPRIVPGGPVKLARGRRTRVLASRATEVASTNWAGYAATQPNRSFRYVRGTFFVPYVDCATTADSFSAHWVGLDGFDSDTVEQAGVLAACNGNTPQYAAWYEMFPQFPVYPDITIRAGDSIMVSVFYRRATGKFVIVLTDTSSGAHFARVLACPSGSTCQRASAEAISEPPTSSSTGIEPLADFRAESFSGIRVTGATGHRGTLRSRRWGTTKIVNISEGGSLLDQPTQLFQGMTFDNYWMRSS